MVDPLAWRGRAGYCDRREQHSAEHCCLAGKRGILSSPCHFSNRLVWVGCPMPAQLVALSEGPSILLDKPILLLGRHPECDIQIDSRKISRRHCCIAQVSDYLVIRDLGSTNGVRINGIRVVEGRLQAGDELTVGNHRYQVTWGDEPPRPRAVVA